MIDQDQSERHVANCLEQRMQVLCEMDVGRSKYSCIIPSRVGHRRGYAQNKYATREASDESGYGAATNSDLMHRAKTNHAHVGVQRTGDHRQPPTTRATASTKCFH